MANIYLTTVTGTYASTTSSLACLQCAAGTFNPGQVAASSCAPCSQGTFASASMASQCTLCPKGSWQTALASPAPCQLCAPGSYAPLLNSTTCLRCPQGSYSTAPNQTALASCLLCSAGYYQSSQGASACSPCAIGTYSSTQGSTLCTACSALTSTLANATALQTQCLCIRGYYAQQGGCVPCPPGTYKNVTSNDSATCLQCPANTYDATVLVGDRTTIDICNKVPDNAWSPPGSTTFACNAGAFYTLAITLNVVCNFCPQGTYSYTSSTACTACVNSTSPSGSPSIASCTCNAGYYRTNTLSPCAPCPASLLYYCPGLAFCFTHEHQDPEPNAWQEANPCPSHAGL